MDKMVLYMSYFILFTSVVSQSCLAASINSKCPFGTSCVLASSCHTVLRLLNQNKTNKVKEMFCEYEGRYAKVCCPIQETVIEFRTLEPSFKSTKEVTTENDKITWPTETTTTYQYEIQTKKPTFNPFPNKTVCGQESDNDRIVGGLIADINEFPWLGRILYETPSGREYYCGATLITDRYLLSAAHCLVHNKFKKPLGVRLGEWDEQTELDCQNGYCAEKPIDVAIEKIILHKDYVQRDVSTPDIALIKLKEPVKFTEFVSPICLPDTEYVTMQEHAQDVPYWTTGWGVTEFGMSSVLKRKLSLKGVSSEICEKIYKRFQKSLFNRVICAGGMAGKDSCSGDSGGPLMKLVKENFQSNWYLFGITSFGNQRCGAEGVPGIYTKVPYYMDWIKSVVST